jgi:hypothetical protein
MKLIIILSLLIGFNPCLAYTSSDGTVVIHKRNRRKALLDYKFLMIDSSPAQSHISSAPTDQAGLSSLSKNPRPSSPAVLKPQATSKPPAESWDDYAQEESCDVSARLLN